MAPPPNRILQSRPTPTTPPAPLAPAAAWVEQHKALTPGNNELQQQLDAWVASFEEEEERRKQEALKAMEDEGWTVVQRHKVGRGRGMQERED